MIIFITRQMPRSLTNRGVETSGTHESAAMNTGKVPPIPVLSIALPNDDGCGRRVAWRFELAVLRTLRLCGLLMLTLTCIVVTSASAEPVDLEVRDASIEGKLDGSTARLVIQANIGGPNDAKESPIYGTALEHAIRVQRDRLSHTFAVRAEAIRGAIRELVLVMSGAGEVREVLGEGLESWSVRQATNGTRSLVIRLNAGQEPRKTFLAQIRAETSLADFPAKVFPLVLTPEQTALGHGYVLIETPLDLQMGIDDPEGVAPIDSKFLPSSLQSSLDGTNFTSQTFRFQGTTYSIPLQVSVGDPEARRVVIAGFQLQGRLEETRAGFTLNATARVKNPQGGVITLLSGGAALSAAPEARDWKLKFEGGHYLAVFEHAGEFPIHLEFNATVQHTGGWNRVSFLVAPGSVSPLRLHGLNEGTQVDLAQAARPQWRGDHFESHLPASGQVELSWRAARNTAEGRLFYAAEALHQIAVSPGLLRQTAIFNLKVMQGELSSVHLRLQGEGEVTRVYGEQVLAWNIESVEGTTERRLVIRFNQPQRDQATVQVELQRSLGAFPLAIDVARCVPEGATRFAGYVRVVNEGAVRLEVLQSAGLSQISPEQFVETDALRALLPAQTTQIFAYRFAGAAHDLRIQADNILPELAVSEVLLYHLRETELSIDGEFELDVRDAPLRELVLRIPKGYGLARIQASGLNDYFLTEPPESSTAQLRLVYGQPISGRQVVQLRLERNQPLAESRWVLPRLEVEKAKSVRGHVGVMTDAGYRLTPAGLTGLTELATAFFPRKVSGLQWAYRVNEPSWEASLTVERLPQTVQADAFHLFSIGEGIAYGSSLVNYVVSGAPVSLLQVELSGEYFNVEFTGKNIRNWQKTANGYDVQLHTPVVGAYTLLVTYERPFRARGETLTFTGARPVNAQLEQGYTLVVSTYQFQVRPVVVSSTLSRIEPAEVPAEYRLFFDAPVLAAYRYSARPFNLQLELNPLAQGEIVSQVIDRAALTSRISEEGQVVTEARYFVKNKGAPHLRLELPAGAELWAVTVDGVTVVPVQDGAAHLIPLPQQGDPDVLTDLRVKMAWRATGSRRITLSAPRVAVPVLLAEWRLDPANGRRLVYRDGTLTPANGLIDRSGFAALARLLSPEYRLRSLGGLIIGLAAAVIAALVWSGAAGNTPSSLRHWFAGLLGLGAALISIISFLQVLRLSTLVAADPEPGLRFVAPVQQAGAAWTVEVANVAAGSSSLGIWGSAFLFIVALGIWAFSWLTEIRWLRRIGVTLGWTLLFWSAIRLEGGLPIFLWLLVVFVFLQLLLPALRSWWRPGHFDSGVKAATAALVLWLGFGSDLTTTARADEGSSDLSGRRRSTTEEVRADLVDQEIQVQDEYVFGTARVRWTARKGQVLPILHEPGVLTQSDHATNQARLVQWVQAGRRVEALLAETDGDLDFVIHYQTRVSQRGEERGLALPVQPALVNRTRITLVGVDVEVTSPQAASIEPARESSSTNTVASLVLAPATDSWISWKPRSRDTRRERTVFFAEWSQLFVPGPGLVEGLHEVQIRPAQGEIGELSFEVPEGATITDVSSEALSLWRFDPDSRRLRVSLAPAQARVFTVIIQSQFNAGPLPLDRPVGLMRVEGAAGQVGMIGVATGNEVQLDDVAATAFSSINLEDFPTTGIEALKQRTPGLTLRRAFRYAAGEGQFSIKASAVEPDVRVESQQTLSLGEDRTVLAAALNVEVIRAGIFKLSFDLPPSLEVESVTGEALSHWTELKSADARTITLHLKGRTLGQHPLSVTLSGPGVRSTNGWIVPRLSLREATKQRGQILIVPEQGLRVQVARRESATQADPVQAGVRQKGVLLFRLLQDPWLLALDLERVDAWIQVTGLQHVSVAEAQLKVTANFQYEVENTGIKSLILRLPAAADNVRFQGEQIADFRASPTDPGGGMRDWEVKLERRTIGRYNLQTSYTLNLPDQATNAVVDGIQARDVNLQRGFVTVQSGGRLQVAVDPPAALQATEWQVIPRTLMDDLVEPAASHAFRLIEPAFQLPLKLRRHEAAQLLPARINNVTLTSVVADDGAMLTQVRIELVPGDKRLLHLTLPAGARFWFAFVNQNSVWPWLTTNQWLLPLENSARAGEATTVEFFYSSAVGEPSRRSLDLELVAPRFDLPLEDIRWHVFLNDKWRLRDWTGSLRLVEEETLVQPASLDLESYVKNEAAIRQQKTRDAEQFLSLANSLLQKGDPQEARRAFQAAYGMSQHDQAFNEDARVQLNNLRMQQALVGLNVRQARVAGENRILEAAPREIRENQTANYTQAEAKQLLDRNSAEENAIQGRLAERLIQQQDAAVASPAAIRATVPEQGRRFTFTRPLDVNVWSELRIGIEAVSASGMSLTRKLATLLLIFAGVVLLTVIGGLRRRKAPAQG